MFVALLAHQQLVQLYHQSPGRTAICTVPYIGDGSMAWRLIGTAALTDGPVAPQTCGGFVN